MSRLAPRRRPPLRLRFALRTRLSVIAATGAVAVLGVTALVLYRDLDSALSKTITEELTIRVNDLAAGMGTGSMPAGSALVTVQKIDRSGTVRTPRGADPLLTAGELERAALGRIVVDRDVPVLGGPGRILARPISRAGAHEVIGVAATSTRPLERSRERLIRNLAIAGPILIAATGAAAWLVAGAALRPVRRMASEAATISAAQTGRRLPEPVHEDEIAELARTLNAMLDRVGTAVANERAFIDDAAHELRTPIAVLRGELELAAQESDDPYLVARGVASALEETDRLTRLAHNLLTLARADAGQLVPGDAVVDLLSIARASARRLPACAGVTVQVRGRPAEVRGEPEWIDHIVTNLISNAARYAKTTALVTVSEIDGRGRLEVADDGPGFPADLLPRAFARFARSDSERGPNGEGAGLGLAIVASIVRVLGGSVAADNGPPLGGARVTVDLSTWAADPD